MSRSVSYINVHGAGRPWLFQITEGDSCAHSPGAYSKHWVTSNEQLLTSCNVNSWHAAVAWPVSIVWTPDVRTLMLWALDVHVRTLVCCQTRPAASSVCWDLTQRARSSQSGGPTSSSSVSHVTVTFVSGDNQWLRAKVRLHLTMLISCYV